MEKRIHEPDTCTVITDPKFNYNFYMYREYINCYKRVCISSFNNEAGSPLIIAIIACSLRRRTIN